MQNKYFWIIDNGSTKSLSLKNELMNILTKNDWLLDKEKSEFVFVIGGDGTFLKNVESYFDKKIIAINGGNLGYYSHFNKENLKKIIKYVSKKSNFRNLLCLKLLINNNQYISLNEILIRSNHTLNTNIYIYKQKLEFFKGTGLMISTPMGSTAHSKNAGGAIIYQLENLIQLLEIHPITQKKYSTLKSPLILDSNVEIQLKSNIKNSANIIIDGKEIEDLFINDLLIKTEYTSFKVYSPTMPKVYIKKLRNSFVREK